MIYVLMQDAADYDEDDHIVFASASKEAVEKKHAELTARVPLLKRFAEIINDEVAAFTKTLTSAPPPVLKDLPPRPLVWLNGKWNNAYELEYAEKSAQNMAKITAFTNEAVAKLNELNRDKNYTQEELESCLDYLRYNPSYSVVEVESD